ncbi:stage V sporulation protein S [Clostridium niameyense]|uniref:Stage V sporulation protein S n=1 Tax=Clostridium niameyense TaxID=1622073 RepID=A0A6M0R795_9CLOT|nr:stage V sporulation protein S [Clostridium niameyense]NEZ46055.1 stage V sporulation protein S [Clostridium niameyense]
MEVLKVSSKSQPKSVAGALAVALREKSSVEIQVVGAGAVNQAIKAIAISRGFITPNGIDLTVVPSFSEVNIGGEKRTAIILLVEPK